MFSRKQYKALAKVIKSSTMDNSMEYHTDDTLLKDMFLFDLCRMLEEDNPRFDKQKFLDACGRQLYPMSKGDMTNWIEGHSVNCYFCGVSFDEREGQNADNYNDNDGGTICPKCLEAKE